MLRFMYRWILSAHPSCFRRRFADEMLSIFDQAETEFAAAKLLVDGVVSLLRQWALRPEFWNQPVAQAPSDGVPLFYTLENTKPRTDALLYGALLSILVLNGACWTMGYAWSHPSFLWIQPAVVRPPESWKHRPSASTGASTAEEEPTYTDAGRVLLVFRSHTPSPGAPPSERTLHSDKSSTPASGNASADVHSSTSPTAAGDVRLPALQSYVGTYVRDSPKAMSVLVTVEQGRLHLEVVGELRSPLVPVSETRFVATAVPDCWLEFAENSSGTVERVELYKGGLHITALRR